jgi:hypothetical protein
LDATEGSDVPLKLVAVTVKVNVPELIPDTVQLSAPLEVQVLPPGEAVAV